MDTKCLLSSLLIFISLLDTFVLGSKPEQSSSPLVTTKAGQIRGKHVELSFGQAVEHFLGVPYAAAPVGDLRFAPPEEAKPWHGVRDATKYGASCPQNESPWSLAGDPQSEDCLFLNIFKPSKATHYSGLPTMVWIHGGGFYTGTGNIFDGSVLASFYNVVIVTINYRLDLLGFLNIPGSEIKGNYGLLDQVAALKWVQENIAGFGGNPEQVTLAGHSAGAASVAMHLLSPLSKRLFQRAICLSGFATQPYAFSVNKEAGKAVVQELDCADLKLIACLRSQNVTKFLSVSRRISSEVAGSMLRPVVTVDGDFLTADPRTLLHQGKIHKVPSILGYNLDDGIGIVTHGLPEPLTNNLDFSFVKDLINRLKFTTKTPSNIIKEIVLYKYTSHLPNESSYNVIKTSKELVTDSWSVAPGIEMASGFALSDVPCYFYVFSHRSAYSVNPEFHGVGHGDELPYIFSGPWRELRGLNFTTGFTEIERGLSLLLMTFSTNFVKYGTPNGAAPSGLPTGVTWPAYTLEKQEYLVIDLEPKVKTSLLADRVAFWNDLIPKVEKLESEKEAETTNNISNTDAL